MRIRVVHAALLAGALFVSTSAFAPAPVSKAPIFVQTQVSAVLREDNCDAMMLCFSQCPTVDVNEWEACKQVCSDLYPCTIGG